MYAFKDGFFLKKKKRKEICCVYAGKILSNSKCLQKSFSSFMKHANDIDKSMKM